MHFIIGAKVDDSNTTGMGRQMHGLGDALGVRGHRVDYLFTESVKSRLGPKLARLEFPLRVAQRIDAVAAGREDPGPIAILHEPVAWPTALFLRRRVRTLAMVHACEARCWRVRVRTRKVTGEQVTSSSRILWPATELLQTVASLKMSDGVLCLSSEDLDFICQRVGVPRDHIERIDNGLESRFLGLPFPDAVPARDILFMGSWLPRKGVRILIAALDQLTAAGVQAKLTLAGTGASADTIRAQLPEPWRSTADIIPHLAAEQLVDVYRRHRLLVLPSVVEGIPLVVLEAMACGLGLIVSAVGGIPDVIVDGKNGVLVPPLDARALASALASALRAPDESQRLARRAHADVQAYGWSRAALQVERFCDARFGSRARGAGVAPSIDRRQELPS